MSFFSGISNLVQSVVATPLKVLSGGILDKPIDAIVAKPAAAISSAVAKPVVNTAIKAGTFASAAVNPSAAFAFAKMAPNSPYKKAARAGAITGTAAATVGGIALGDRKSVV